MFNLHEEYCEELAGASYIIYKLNGISQAFDYILEKLKNDFPLVRINLAYSSSNASHVITLGDTYHEMVQATVNEELPLLLLPELMEKPLCLGNIKEHIRADILENPAFYNLPLLLHKSLLRIPYKGPQNWYLLFNFWSDEENAFSEDYIEIFSHIINRLASELVENLNILPQDNSNPGIIKKILPENYLSAYKGLSEVTKQINLVGPTGVTTLILGETGVGKEYVADAIQQASAQKGLPFIKVNCGAIPTSLIESELFGHEKGAFTGALMARKGYFEYANNGTIFLDEIGELPLRSQVQLLRVLDTGCINRVGSPKTIELNVRIIAATQPNLIRKVEKGTFREDLWYRLSVYPILVPPLRERKIDIIPLVNYFISQHSAKLGVLHTRLDEESIKMLMAHDWPGNVRELQHVVINALIHARGKALDTPLQFNIPKMKSTKFSKQKKENEWKTLDETTKDYISDVLAYTHGKMTGKNSATEILGIHYSTLKAKMKEMGIPLPREKSK